MMLTAFAPAEYGHTQLQVAHDGRNAVVRVDGSWRVPADFVMPVDAFDSAA
jgi:hypothetical protein